MSSPTALSRKLLEAEGYTVDVVERWLPQARRRLDLFGFADLIAIRKGEGPLLVQTTSATNMASRRTKILAEPRAALWVATGGRILLHGWRPKVKGVRAREVRAEYLAPTIAAPLG